jgi:hypothetical protein
MAYTIAHGEIGFDILKDGQVADIGFRSRRAAMAEIREIEKREATRERGKVEAAKYVLRLREDYDLSPTEILDIIKKVLEG